MLEHEVASKDVITWLPQGQAFKVYNSKDFEAHLLPKYFKHSKIASFQRQLNLYGFKRIVKGDDVGAYYHPQLLRGRRDLLRDIQRISNYVKCNKSENEPDSLHTATVPNLTTIANSTATTVESAFTSSTSLSSMGELVAYEVYNAGDTKKSNENDQDKCISVLEFLDDAYVFGDELYEYRDGSVHTTRQVNRVNGPQQATFTSNSITTGTTDTHLVDITKNPYFNKLNVEKYNAFCTNINTKPSKITQNIGYTGKPEPRKKFKDDKEHTAITPIASRVVDEVFGSCDSFSQLI